MQLTIHKGSKRLVGELDKNILLEDLQDIIDLLGNAGYLQTEGIIIRKVNLPNSFFELRNGLAGEVFRNFQTTVNDWLLLEIFQLLKVKVCVTLSGKAIVPV